MAKLGVRELSALPPLMSAITVFTCAVWKNTFDVVGCITPSSANLVCSTLQTDVTANLQPVKGNSELLEQNQTPLQSAPERVKSGVSTRMSLLS